MDKEVREIVWERCGGWCEFCGLPLDPEAWDFHHRQLTTKLDLISNGVATCHFCHVIAPESIHQNPQFARTKGFIISKFTKQNEFPSVPLFLGGGKNPLRGKWVLLAENGTYSNLAN
jgi:hypothetical protein